MRMQSQTRIVVFFGFAAILFSAVSVPSSKVVLERFTATARGYFDTGRSWIVPLQINEMTIGVASAR